MQTSENVEGLVVVNQSVLVTASVNRVFEVVCDHKSFPVITGGKLVRGYVPLLGGLSRWMIDVSGCPIGWTQRTTIVESAHEVQFSRVEGDFEIWEGVFRVSEAGEGVEISLAFRCQVGIPVIDGLLKPVLEQKMGEFARQLLASLKLRVESPVAD